MATKKIYDACCRKLQSMPLYSLNGSGVSKRLLKPDMHKLFGKKELVSKIQFERSSKAEQARHLREDRILSILYIELNPYFENSVVRTKMVTHANDF
nr:MAG TPA: hypothetical protein [Bacteriophage sp.]